MASPRLSQDADYENVHSIPDGEVQFNEQLMATAEEIEELEIVHQGLEQLRLQIRDKRILVSPFLVDFDRSRSCHISRDQFFRGLTMAGLHLPPNDLQILGKHYGSRRFPDRVNYRAFLAHLEYDAAAEAQAAEEEAVRAMGARSLSTKATSAPAEALSRSGVVAMLPPPSAVSHDVVFSKIVDTAQKRRLLLHDTFADWDKLRKGRITESQFTRSLMTFGFEFTAPEISALLEPYRIADMPGSIDYVAFTNAVHALVYDEKKRSERAVPELLADFEQRVAMQESGQADSVAAQTQELVHRIGYAAHTRRILLKPSFKSFDKNNNGCVTERQFRSLVATYPVSLSEADWEALCDYYRRGALGISYADFLADVDASEDEHRGRALGTHDRQIETSRLPPRVLPKDSKPTVEAARAYTWTSAQVLDRLRSEVARRRVDLIDCFDDFDRLRKGRITETQFRRTLSNATKLELSDEEFTMILRMFGTPEQPGFVDYIAFSNCMMEVPHQRFGASTRAPVSLVRPIDD